MPIEMSRSDEQRRITFTITDPWSVEEVAVAVDRQASDAAWKYGTVYDLRRTSWVPSEPDILWLVKRGQQQVMRHGPRGPVAVILDARVQAGALQQYATYAGAQGIVRVRVFTELEPAQQWLDASDTR